MAPGGTALSRGRRERTLGLARLAGLISPPRSSVTGCLLESTTSISASLNHALLRCMLHPSLWDVKERAAARHSVVNTHAEGSSPRPRRLSFIPNVDALKCRTEPGGQGPPGGQRCPRDSAARKRSSEGSHGDLDFHSEQNPFTAPGIMSNV